MKKTIITVLLYITALTLLIGCSASFEEKQQEAVMAVEEAFKNSETKKTNNSNEHIEFYTPFGFEIVEQAENNIILKNGSKTYVLFYNQHESKDSKVVYHATIQQKEEYDVNHTFENDGNFGYLLINNLEKENELTVGIGGVKITTETKTSSMVEEAASLMGIVKSVKVK